MGVIEFIGLWAPWGCLSWLHVTPPVAPCGVCLGVLRPPARSPSGRPLRPKGHMCPPVVAAGGCLPPSALPPGVFHGFMRFAQFYPAWMENHHQGDKDL